jgi:hypothetical protein
MSDENMSGRIHITREVVEQGHETADVQVAYEGGLRAVVVGYRASIPTGRVRILRSIVGQDDSEIELANEEFRDHGGRYVDYSALADIEANNEYVYRAEVTH